MIFFFGLYLLLYIIGFLRLSIELRMIQLCLRMHACRYDDYDDHDGYLILI